MPRIQIRRHDNHTILYEGMFDTAKACVESAIQENICLDYADLRYANLHSAALDGAIMRYAKLDNTNMNGANLSEAILSDSYMNNANLIDTCLCETDLTRCHFINARFGATDIGAATLDYALFSTLPALVLDFKTTASMQNCRFNLHENVMLFSRPPITISGMDWPIHMLDNHMGIGTRFKTYNEWFAAQNDNTNPNIKDGSAYIARFIQMHRKTLISLAEFHNRFPKGRESHQTKTVA